MHKLFHHVSVILPMYLRLLRDTVSLDIVLCMSYNLQPSELAYVAPLTKFLPHPPQKLCILHKTWKVASSILSLLNRKFLLILDVFSGFNINIGNVWMGW